MPSPGHAPTTARSNPFRLLAASLLVSAALLLANRAAFAQAVPVDVDISGDTATIEIGGMPGHPLADMTLTFDDADGLSASSLGVSAKLVSLDDPALLARLPNLQLTRLDSALPLLVTVEPPAAGGLAFDRTVRVEIHTHALAYEAGSSYRLFKAPLNGAFRDITDEVAPGSVRARGTTGGFSQFLVLADLRETGAVIDAKLAWLRGRVAMLPATEQGAFDALVDDAEAAVDAGDHAAAIAALDSLRARAAARAGTHLPQTWRATRTSENHAGELIAGAATLAYSVAYLRDYGE
ncbi:hypothetical protein GCM10028862_05170 [Luteimonas pelagia]